MEKFIEKLAIETELSHLQSRSLVEYISSMENGDLSKAIKIYENDGYNSLKWDEYISVLIFMNGQIKDYDIR